MYFLNISYSGYMKLTRGTSIEITDKLTSETATMFAQWIGGYNVIKNQKTAMADEEYSNWVERGKPPNARPAVDASAAHITKELTFLKSVPSSIRRNAASKWFETMQGAINGTHRKPRIRNKYRKRSCYVTNEVFHVQPLSDNQCTIHIKPDALKGNRGKSTIGITVPYGADSVGKSFYLSRKGARFWLSIAGSVDYECSSRASVKRALALMNDDELKASTIGYDLGVSQLVTDSNGIAYGMADAEITKSENLEVKKKRYQRKYARIARANDKTAKINKRKRSKAEIKLQAKISKISTKMANIRKYTSHCISKKISDDVPVMAVFEDIKINNMVRRPHAVKCQETGKWKKNGAAAKRGLNRAILAANMGQIRQFTMYKLEQKGKLGIEINARKTSQECSECGHTEKSNRKSQSKFSCNKCGFELNADYNAAINIKNRGRKKVGTESFSKEKTVKTKAFRRKSTSSNGAGTSVKGDGGDVILVKQVDANDVPNSKRDAANSLA